MSNSKLSLPDWNEVTTSVSKASRILISKVTPSTNQLRDSELDELILKSRFIEKQVKSLQEQSLKYRISISKLISNALSIGNAFQSISSLNEPELLNNPGHAFDLYTKSNNFINQHKKLHESIDYNITSFDEHTKERIKLLLKHFKIVNKSITELQHFKTSLESSEKDWSALNQKSDLSAREHKKKFESESKIEEFKLKYNSYSKKLKSELPLFINFSSSIMQQISISVYFCILRVFYELYIVSQDSNSNDTEISIMRFDDLIKMLRLKQNDANESVSNLKITNFTRISFTSNFNYSNGSMRTISTAGTATTKISDNITNSNANSNSIVDSKDIVVACFEYKGIEPGDLSFQVGDQIRILHKDPSGWWKGAKLNDRTEGLFPYNYVNF